MERASVGGIELEYRRDGVGDPVLLLHGAFIADSFAPLFAEPSLIRSFELIAPRRRGYGDSSRPAGPTSIEEQASDAAGLLRGLGHARAHVVGHSFGGLIALQLALDAPELVQSLALLEPALAVGESGPGYHEALAQGGVRYRDVGAAAALPEFLRARWPQYEETLESVVAGAFDQAVVDAVTWFERELPAQLGWTFDESAWARITQPVLTVLGGTSDALWPRFGETHRAILERLPGAEGAIVPDATHFLQLESPTIARGMAAVLADFFARHAVDQPPGD